MLYVSHDLCRAGLPLIFKYRDCILTSEQQYSLALLFNIKITQAFFYKKNGVFVLNRKYFENESN